MSESTAEQKPLVDNTRSNLPIRNICKWCAIITSSLIGLIFISFSSVYFYYSPTIIWFEKCPANPNSLVTQNLTLENYNQFLGQWYDMAHTQNPLQKGLCPTDTYHITDHGPRIFRVDYEETDQKSKERVKMNPQSLTFIKNGLLHADFSYDPENPIDPDTLTDGNYKVFYLPLVDGNLGNKVTVYSCLDIPIIGSAPLFWVMSREIEDLSVSELQSLKDMLVEQYRDLGASEKAVGKMRDTFVNNVMENCS